VSERQLESFYRRTGKRLFDIAVALPALVFLAPVLGIIALLARWQLGRPVLFRQERPGQAGRPFTLLKFRTMNEARDTAGNLLPDEVRMTRFGRFLRQTSLDELPELLNILRGEMSFVGPRPLLVRYLPFYSERERLRFSVRPGLTGWAQVNGRHRLPWNARLALDVWYVEHCSLLLDLRIIAITFLKMIIAESTANPQVPVPALDVERGSLCAPVLSIVAGSNGVAYVSKLQPRDRE
jgi:lipopolysaccharide/colanic/teichoic acid biosynthesis glycosyltransferase